MPIKRVIILLVFVCSFYQIRGQIVESLTIFATDPHPYLHIQANSDQRQPYYLGLNPRQLTFGGYEPPTIPSLPPFMKYVGEVHMKAIYMQLVQDNDIHFGDEITIEMWPLWDDWGNSTFGYNRWKLENEDWKWIAFNYSYFELHLPLDQFLPDPFLPVIYNASIPADFHAIFDDFLLFDDLYDKRVFGDCVWTDNSGDTIYGAWLPLDRIDYFYDQVIFSQFQNICRVAPQPSRFNGVPISFLVEVSNEGVQWPSNISWDGEIQFSKHKNPQVIFKQEGPIIHFPENFNETWSRDLLILDGEAEATFPISGKKMFFQRKSSADPGFYFKLIYLKKDTQLMSMVAYFEERYAVLGISTERLQFSWRNVTQAVLIAKIEPSGENCSSEAPQDPILMLDHYDTAFCEDIFNETGRRVSTKGADDNVSATTTLLQAASLLLEVPTCIPIWLVHLTGEEFPGDDLGARHLVSHLLQNKQDITGAILMDMIAHVEIKGDTIFQVNFGLDEISYGLAEIVLGATENVNSPYITPAMRAFYDPYSYLFNTDGDTFTKNGFPVVLLNEHINLYQNFDRIGYHDSFDTSKLINWDYGTSVAKVAIETVAELASGQQFIHQVI